MSDFVTAGIIFVVAMAIFGFVALFFLIVVVSGSGESNQMRKYDRTLVFLRSNFVRILHQKAENFDSGSEKRLSATTFVSD